MNAWGLGIWRGADGIRVLRCPGCHRNITVADGRLVPHRDLYAHPCHLSGAPVEDGGQRRDAPRRPQRTE